MIFLKFLNGFLSSRIITVMLIIALGGAVLYIYNEGKQACVTNTLELTIEKTEQARKDREDAEKFVQNHDDIDALLAQLGIMRGD